MNKTEEFSKIDKLIKDGNYDLAIKEYLLLLEKEPNHKGLREGLGKLYLNIGNEKKAKEYIEIDDFKKDISKPNSKLIFSKIDKLIKDGNYDLAIKEYLLLLEKEPNHKGLREGLGKLYLNIGNEKKAKEYIEIDDFKKDFEFEFEKTKIKYLRLLKEKPHNKEIKEKLGRLYLNIGEENEAKKYINNSLIKKIKEEDKILLKKINNLINNSKFLEAEELYLKLLKEKPGHKGLEEGLGNLYLEMGNIKKAKKYIKKEDLEKDCSFREEFKRLNKLIDNKDILSAEKLYLKLLKEKPGHKGLKEGLGELYIEIGKEDEAKKYIDNRTIKKIKEKLNNFNI